MSNKAMEIVDRLRIESGISKTEITGGAPNRYYEHLAASDIRVDTFAKYLKRLGYKIIITKEGLDI